MHMRIHEPGHQQGIAVVHHPRLRMGGAQVRALAQGDDAPPFDQDAARAVMDRGGRSCGEWIGGEAQGLAQQERLCGHGVILSSAL